MQRILDFVDLRIRQLRLDLRVYGDLGPVYSRERERVAHTLEELNGIRSTIQLFMDLDQWDKGRPTEKIKDADTSTD